MGPCSSALMACGAGILYGRVVLALEDVQKPPRVPNSSHPKQEPAKSYLGIATVPQD